MNIIAFLIILWVLMKVEVKLYQQYIFKDLSYSCKFSKQEVYEGEEFEIIETVSNNKWLPLSCLKSEMTTSKWLEVASTYSIANDINRLVPSLFTLRGRQKITRRWKVVGQKRGCFSIKEVTLVGTDLMGLYSSSQIIKMDAQVTVLPKPLKVNEALIKSDATHGERVVKRFILEDPFYILGVREYTQREPMNRIHWGMTARHHQIMVHNNAHTSKQNRLLILNMQSHDIQRAEVISEDKIEEAIRICSGILEQALEANIMIGFATNTKLGDDEGEIFVPADAGNHHTHRIRQILAWLPLRITEDYENYMETLRLEPETTEIILVTCFLTQQVAQVLRNHIRKGVMVKVIVMDYPKNEEAYLGIDRYYTGGTMS